MPLLSLRLYYLALCLYFSRNLFVSSESFMSFVGKLNVETSWLALSLSSNFGYPYWAFILFCLSGLVACVSAFRNPNRQYLRIAIALCGLLISNDAGHAVNCLLLPAFVLAFLGPRWFSSSEGQKEAHRAALCAFLFPYFASGAWKLLTVGEALIGGSSPARFLNLHIYELYNENNFFGKWLIEHTFASGILYFSTIALQIAIPLCLWRPRWIAPFGLFLIFFHVGAVQILAADFEWNILAALCLMVSYPFHPSAGGATKEVNS